MTRLSRLAAHADELQQHEPAIANVLRQVVLHRDCESSEAYDVIESMSSLPEFTGVEWEDRWRVERYVRYVIVVVKLRGYIVELTPQAVAS